MPKAKDEGCNMHRSSTEARRRMIFLKFIPVNSCCFFFCKQTGVPQLGFPMVHLVKCDVSVDLV